MHLGLLVGHNRSLAGVPMARAVFSVKCANVLIYIHKNDHFPPHCNFLIRGRKVKFRLDTMEVYQSTFRLTPPVLRCIRKYREAMLAAWRDHVNVIPTPPRGPQR